MGTAGCNTPGIYSNGLHGCERDGLASVGHPKVADQSLSIEIYHYWACNHSLVKFTMFTRPSQLAAWLRSMQRAVQSHPACRQRQPLFYRHSIVLSLYSRISPTSRCFPCGLRAFCRYPASPSIAKLDHVSDAPVRVTPAGHSFNLANPRANIRAKMPEYIKMKNADLEALLKGRGLPHTGKKAEMVERLQKDDEKSASKSAAGAEDEIDWDDEVEEAAAAPVAPTEEPVTTNEETVANAGGKGQPPNPQAVPNQVADINPAATDDLSVQPPADGAAAASADTKTEEPKEPAPNYSIGLAATNLDEEIEKRKKRALKFGIKVEDDEGLKKLERAKKFGAVGPPQGLDEALPERNRKRGHEAGDEAGGNKRREGGGRGGARGGRGGRDYRDNRDYRDHRDRNGRDGRDNRRGDNKPSNGQGLSWMSEKDRAAAEARRAKFAKPTA